MMKYVFKTSNACNSLFCGFSYSRHQVTQDYWMSIKYPLQDEFTPTHIKQPSTQNVSEAYKLQLTQTSNKATTAGVPTRECDKHTEHVFISYDLTCKFLQIT